VVGASCASGAPELLVNGGGEEPVDIGWTLLQGDAGTTGPIPDSAGGFYGPDQGDRFIQLGPDTHTSVTQAGTFPFGAQRLFLEARIRTPGDSEVTVTLRGLDLDGSIEVERSITISGLGEWTRVTRTYAIPSFAETWDLIIEAPSPGQFGVHADALSLIGTCRPDFNGDRLVNFFDISTYLALFQSGDPEADLTGNGTIDFFDINRLMSDIQFPCE